MAAAALAGLSQPALGSGTGRDPSTDQLALALSDVARHHGYMISPLALVDGLPLVAGRLPLEHVGLAADRAGLRAELSDADPLHLADWALPVLVSTDDGGVDVLWSIERDGRGEPVAVEMSEPGRPQVRLRLSTTELASALTGRIVKLAPQADQAESGAPPATARPTDWLWSAFAGSRRIYIEAIAATFAINVLALAMPLYTMNVYDRVLPNAASDTLWALSIGIILATLFDLLIKCLRSTFVDTASRRADVMMANFVYSRVMGARLNLRPQSVGVRANTLRELETLREFLSSATLTTFGDLPFGLLFIAMIAVIAGPLALVVLAAIPLLIGIGWLTQASMARLTARNQRQNAVRNAVAVESLVGLETIKSAGAESWAASAWERTVAESIRSSTELRHLSSFGLYVIHATQTLTQIVMVIAGFYMVAAGSITSGALIAATMLAGRAVQPLSQLAMLIARLHQTRISFDMLSEIVHASQERAPGIQLIGPESFEGALAFENVTFNYDQEAPPVLRDVSFEVRPGERVGVIGGIGSGKSTALKLMQALVETQQGRVLVDGLPVGQLDPALLRRAVRLALQDAELFRGTIRSNIALACPGASDAAVLRAAEAAGALGWIARLPRAFDTEVRERGLGLSGGQRRSVTLARALIGDPRIVLLDEPTSDMDARSEQHFIASLQTWLGKRTLIVVTHRPAMFDLVDRLIVLDQGRKLLDGPKASVIAALTQMEKARRSTVEIAPHKEGGRA